jgi:CIC family chloride channel protein
MARAPSSTPTDPQTQAGNPTVRLALLAAIVGVVAGFGAAGFRELVYGCTWLFTGHSQFGQQGHASSAHLPGLGFWFVLAAPVISGLLYGPLVQRFAREARGHGVPEVMVAVARNGGRIRPQVVVIKALASALCIGGGGSVGREGPIVQIGSAFASAVGQVLKLDASSTRILVAFGAAGGIAATFNAPLTGVLFATEIILREVSLQALCGSAISAAMADLVARAFFGSAPFLSGVPHDLSVHGVLPFVLLALLGVISAGVGQGFKTVLYGMEDGADRLWHGRPEWSRPAVGGLALGGLLLILPQMYGVGYPVMDKVLGGNYALGFVLALLVGKLLATSLTLAIGGSGGVFAPSLFIGAATGTAYGSIAHHIFGASAGPTVIYGVVAMGGVFAGATQAPLTAVASVAEMSGNFTLMVPILLVSAIAATCSRRISYSSIYTEKLLRRGIDIEGEAPSVWQIPAGEPPPSRGSDAAVEHPDPAFEHPDPASEPGEPASEPGEPIPAGPAHVPAASRGSGAGEPDPAGAARTG